MKYECGMCADFSEIISTTPDHKPIRGNKLWISPIIRGKIRGKRKEEGICLKPRIL
jgi:hypothetical protein